MGMICSHDDPDGRPSVYAYVRQQLKLTSHIISVGRLDFNSEGLMLITNDGQLARAMELPESAIPRVR
jgi:23S rRNA pseudouridine2605 synthase